jgi:hypothetical protein
MSVWVQLPVGHKYILQRFTLLSKVLIPPGIEIETESDAC